MTSHHHEDPAAEGAARAAQLAAMTLSITEGLVRLRSERLAAKTTDDERAAGTLRARHRVDHAASWLQRRTGPAQRQASGEPVAAASAAAGQAPAPDPRAPVTVAIICTPRDLADQAFPIPMPDAMATAAHAAQQAVRGVAALPAAPARTQLNGPAPSRPRGGTR
jgi:type VI protein secretion system component VasA